MTTRTPTNHRKNGLNMFDHETIVKTNYARAQTKMMTRDALEVIRDQTEKFGEQETATRLLAWEMLQPECEELAENVIDMEDARGEA